MTVTYCPVQTAKGIRLRWKTVLFDVEMFWMRDTLEIAAVEECFILQWKNLPIFTHGELIWNDIES